MKTNSKQDIVSSLNAMDEVQMFKVLDFIRSILVEEMRRTKRPSREQAIREIQLALRDSELG